VESNEDKETWGEGLRWGKTIIGTRKKEEKSKEGRPVEIHFGLKEAEEGDLKKIKWSSSKGS